MKNVIIKSTCNKKRWYYIDATNKILGRLCTMIAYYLKGKNKVEYTPNCDFGDYIIVINASKIIVTGKKKTNKFYYRHTGYIGGIKKTSFKEMLINYPEKIIQYAVRGMLPKGSLGRSMLLKLKIYSDNKHHHDAQQPKLLDI